ncbi:MAG TPA: hypothetical protein VN661_10040 [Candidatus Acidoferrales bacterium]|nr:hypothetical protein [Candidatus Acidoferrales bacterium]
MKSFSIFAAVLAGVAIMAAAPAARGQAVRPAPILDRAHPVHVPSQAVSSSWLRAEVIHADGEVLIVREQGNGLMVHTFSYAPALKIRMQQIEDAGGYHYGDKIKVLWQPGGTVAYKIKGKPSKSS